MTVNYKFLNHINHFIDIQKNKTQLLVVTKNRPIDDVKMLLHHGHRVFGENRVQEAITKYKYINVNKYKNFQLHLIGPLQSNKAQLALENFDVIQTIDRVKIIDTIVKLRGTAKDLKTKKFFIQINIGEESQKNGILPNSASSLYNYAIEQKLNIVGLMCIPPNNVSPVKYFKRMNEIKNKINFNLLLSMGMSSDFESAIECNSNLVRIGSKIFE